MTPYPPPAYAASAARAPLGPHSIQRRVPGPRDVSIDIAYCGVCHSDIHQVRDEWDGARYPMVPGHEIVGRVARVGAAVTKFAVGDLAGVGCMVDACRTCDSCRRGDEQFCLPGAAFTYNSTEMDRATPTYGGYSTHIVVDEAFTLRLSPKLALAAVAPLLCAGITTYSPLKQWQVKAGDRVGVVGLGGLGHMAVKLAVAMGAEVTLLSTTPQKEADAKRLGAHAFGLTRDPATFTRRSRYFDLIVDTVSAQHDYNELLGTLRPYGTLVVVGIPPERVPLGAGGLIMGNRRLVGSLIGGIKETQEMLDYCAERDLVADVEVIAVDRINDAYERMLKGDVRYRFVIDTQTLRG